MGERSWSYAGKANAKDAGPKGDGVNKFHNQVSLTGQTQLNGDEAVDLAGHATASADAPRQRRQPAYDAETAAAAPRVRQQPRRAHTFEKTTSVASSQGRRDGGVLAYMYAEPLMSQNS